jgi:uncharacterized protein GlcG (DUF336 family)
MCRVLEAIRKPANRSDLTSCSLFPAIPEVDLQDTLTPYPLPEDCFSHSLHPLSINIMSTKTVPTLTFDGARIALAAAEARAKEIKVPMNIAIMDNACHLLAFARMEGAKITSINIAIDKAFTAVGHRAPTSTYKDNVYPGGPAFGINHSNGGRFMTIAGGVPITKDGVVVGAVGCSTGLPSQDEDVAKKGVEAVEKSFGLKAKL